MPCNKNRGCQIGWAGALEKSIFGKCIRWTCRRHNLRNSWSQCSLCAWGKHLCSQPMMLLPVVSHKSFQHLDTLSPGNVFSPPWPILDGINFYQASKEKQVPICKLKDVWKTRQGKQCKTLRGSPQPLRGSPGPWGHMGRSVSKQNKTEQNQTLWLNGKWWFHILHWDWNLPSHLRLLQSWVSVSAVVHVAVLPPCWAMLQLRDLLLVWRLWFINLYFLNV